MNAVYYGSLDLAGVSGLAMDSLGHTGGHDWQELSSLDYTYKSPGNRSLARKDASASTQGKHGPRRMVHRL